jgi:nucleoside-diphosphate-sugar epimerase
MIATINDSHPAAGNDARTAREDFLCGPEDPVLITGASGFIGTRVVERLLDLGFRNLRCFARPSGRVAKLEDLVKRRMQDAAVSVIRGNLLSPEDCRNATRDAAVVLHLAAGRGEKSVPDAFMNSVVTTRNLLAACVHHRTVKRFVNVSSFTVYNNRENPSGSLLDESCPLETHPELRGDAYDFAKVKQDEIVIEYGKNFGLPYVIVRPGFVYGPGNESITGRVGIGTFGMFLHLGGPNRIPFTYVDNCADAIVLAGLKKGIDSEAFNVVDDDLPTSRQFLRLYKRNVRDFKSLYIPHLMSYTLCYLWEKYSVWSEGQLPLSFNRRKWYGFWKRTRYSNQKLKTRLGWAPRVPTSEGLMRYFESCRAKANA